jgi:hypothetical protein
MSTSPYDEILRRAQLDLDAEQQLRLIEELSQSAGAPNGRRSIRELKGLGKEVGEGVDASEYVREERDSWNG